MPSSGPPAPSRVDASNADSRQRRGRLLRVLYGWPLKAALSLGLIVLLVSNLNATAVSEALLAADKLLVASALAALAVIPLLAAERWRVASIAAGVSLPRRFFYPATYAALFAGQFLPSSIGTDAVRLALLFRQRVSLRSAFQCVAIDRVCGVGAILALMYIGMPFALDLLPAGAAIPIAATTALMIAGCAALLFVDRLPLGPAWREGWLGRPLTLIGDIRAAFGAPQTVVALLFGIAIHALAVLGILLLARAFGYTLRFRDLLTVSTFAVFAGLLPVSFNGWGVREGAFMLGLSLLAVPREIALMISVLFGVGGAVCTLPGSVTWFRLRRAHGAASVAGNRSGDDADVLEQTEARVRRF